MSPNSSPLPKTPIVAFVAVMCLALSGVWYQERKRRTVPPFPAQKCLDHSPIIEMRKGIAVTTCQRAEGDMLNTHLAYSINGRWTIEKAPAFQIHRDETCPSYD